MAVTDPALKGWVDAQAPFLRDAASAAVPLFHHYVAPLAGAVGVVLVGKWLARAPQLPPVKWCPFRWRLRRAGCSACCWQWMAPKARQRPRHLSPCPEYARAQTVDVHLLNAQRPVSGDVATFVAGETLDDYYSERSEQALAPARALLAAAGLAAHEHRRVGDPGPLISEVAQAEGCDHIVMGARGLGTHTGALLGSVARSTAEHASIPVLLVK